MNLREADLTEVSLFGVRKRHKITMLLAVSNIGDINICDVLFVL